MQNGTLYEVKPNFGREYMRNYGNALRYLRRSKNYTQQDMAKMLNVSPQTISKWENGVNQIRYCFRLRYFLHYDR